MEQYLSQEIIPLIKSNHSTRWKGQKTAKQIKKAIKHFDKNLTPSTIINQLISIGRKVSALDHLAFAITNTIKKAISLTRQHSNNAFDEENLINVLSRETTDLQENLSSNPEGNIHCKMEYLQGQDDIVDEFETIYTDLNDKLLPYINNEEVVLTWGYSETILQCFEQANKDGKKIIVQVAKNNLKNDGPLMVKMLREKSIESYLVEDASICTVLQKVNKVIINCFSLLADGGILACSGTYAVAMVAKDHSIPFIVVTPSFKVTPKYSFGQDTFNEFKQPEQVFQRTETEKEENIDVVVPSQDYLPSDYISQIISQQGEYTTDYIYRLFKQSFSQEEYMLDF